MIYNLEFLKKIKIFSSLLSFFFLVVTSNNSIKKNYTEFLKIYDKLNMFLYVYVVIKLPLTSSRNIF